jgi:hypothetical protein
VPRIDRIIAEIGGAKLRKRKRVTLSKRLREDRRSFKPSKIFSARDIEVLHREPVNGVAAAKLASV